MLANVLVNYFIQLSPTEHSKIKNDTYCRTRWRKSSGVTRSRRRNAWTSCLCIGWYFVTALRWKYSWNNLLCLHHIWPYGLRPRAKRQFILQRSVSIFEKFLEVKGLGTSFLPCGVACSRVQEIITWHAIVHAKHASMLAWYARGITKLDFAYSMLWYGMWSV